VQGELHPTSINDLYARLAGDDAKATAALIDLLLSEELTNRYFAVIRPAIDLFRECGRGGSVRAETRGCALFFVLHRLATLPDEARDTKLINTITADPDFLAYFQKFYNINGVGLRSIAFHASGTTSLIFKALTDKFDQCALKVIQAPYVRLPSIRAATKAYEITYGIHTRYSPKIYKSDELWIAMEFVDGPNLNEYIQKLRRHTKFLTDDYIEGVSLVLRKLTKALSYYEENGLVHGDLTPFNIMVETDAGQHPEALKLIDFGPNYVLKDRLGTRRIFAEAFSRTELFTAPEVLAGVRDASLESDLYSLGMIGLDLLCSEPLRKDRVGVRLREIWETPATVGIAQIIEDLIDDAPENRSLIVRERGFKSVYETIDSVLQSHLATYKELHAEARKLQIGPDLKLDVFQSVIALGRMSRIVDPYYTVTRLQLTATRLNFICQTAIISAFLLYTALDAKMHFATGSDVPFDGLAERIVAVLPKSFVVGDFWANLPGRCVALTFGLVAARYYANIFAPLRPVGISSALAFVTNVLMRINCLSYFVPCMAAIAWDPQWWPFCALAGTLFPALNNLFCWLLAKLGAAKSREVFSVEEFHRAETARFLGYYKEWWILMGAYSVSLGVIGILLRIGVAQDAFIYAGMVCIINVFKLYRINAGSEAPYISGHLARLMFSLRRWARRQAGLSAGLHSTGVMSSTSSGTGKPRAA
jgi:hypothetical protein